MPLKAPNLIQNQLLINTLGKVPTEKKEAVWFIEWAHSHHLIKDVIIHIPNEGKRSKITGYFLKKQGMRKGVSDFFLPIPMKPFHGLWIELKTMDHKAKVSAEQLEWLARMREMGYAAYVAYGWVHASDIVLSYLHTPS